MPRCLRSPKPEWAIINPSLPSHIPTDSHTHILSFPSLSAFQHFSFQLFSFPPHTHPHPHTLFPCPQHPPHPHTLFPCPQRLHCPQRLLSFPTHTHTHTLSFPVPIDSTHSLSLSPAFPQCSFSVPILSLPFSFPVPKALDPCCPQILVSLSPTLPSNPSSGSGSVSESGSIFRWFYRYRYRRRRR